MKKIIIILLLIITGFAASQASAQVSGKLTFLYKGVVVDAGHFPNSTTVTDSFPGYINVSLIPANASGIPLGGPAATLPSTGGGVAYASLNALTGEYNYTFSGVANGTYIVVPMFTNPLLTGSASRVTIGHYGAIAAGYGTPVVINNNTIPNVNIFIDTRLAQSSVLGARNTTSATFAGSFTITAGLANFPTGTPGVPGQTWLGLAGYKTTTPMGGQPDILVAITKPAVGNVAVFTKESLAYGTYNRITLNAYNYLTAVYTTPLASYTVGMNCLEKIKSFEKKV
jgi:hypothetical protein